VNTLVAHERAADLAAVVTMNLQAAGIEIGLEPSPANLRGLSHREWGDATGALAVLVETTNPAQGRLRGATGPRLVVDGRDRFYVRAASRGRLSVPFAGSGWPLSLRVARHLAAVGELIRVFSESSEDRAVTVTGIPGHEEVIGKGVGAFLAPPGE
jgi:hypothetical protein